MIEHIVFSGGALSGIYEYGALVKLHEEHFWNYKNIKSVYGTSVGAILCILFCLQENFESFTHYLINRPWDKVLNICPESILNIYENRGLFDVSVLKAFFNYWFQHKKWSPEMTMKELYKKTGIDVFIYTVEVSTLKVIEISHYSHPDLKVYTALAMSCSIPLLFQPVWYKHNFYIDGGLKCNYPIEYCLNRVQNKDSILGMRVSIQRTEHEFNENIHIVNYFVGLMRNCMHELSHTYLDQYTITYEIKIPCVMYEDYSYSILKDSEIRKKMIEDGKKYAEVLLSQVTK